MLLAVPANAQTNQWLPSSVRVGADPGTFFYAIFSEKRNFFEVEADVDINRFFLVANYGTSDYLLDEPTYRYANQGSYMRLGIDINLLQQDTRDNVLFFGLRYAASSFDNQLDYNTRQVIQSETGWPDSRETVAINGMNARWYEMVTGLKIRIVRQLLLGFFTVRYKVGKSTSSSQGLRPYYIPGFGKNIGTAGFGLNYYVSYRLPFRKKSSTLETLEENLE
jgi:hypothetical protein